MSEQFIQDCSSHSPINSPFASPLNSYSNSYSYSNSSVGSPVSNKSDNIYAGFKPNDVKSPKPNEVHLINNIELGILLEETNAEKLSGDGDVTVLCLDLRSYNEYSKAHIADALHISLPSTLLRRRSFTFEKLLENLSFNDRALISRCLNETSLINNPKLLKIIIYENCQNQTADSISLASYGISSKIIDFLNLSQQTDNQQISFNKDNISVMILANGFSQFQLLFPDYIAQTNENDNSELSVNTNSITKSPSNLDSKMNLRLNISNSYTPPKNSNDSYDSSSPLNNSSQNIYSPISTSSPISALLKFQLPSHQGLPTNLFKFQKNEELMNIESYLSAVNIKEDYENHIEQKLKEKKQNIKDKQTLDSFVFPKRENQQNNTQDSSSSPVDSTSDSLNINSNSHNLLKSGKDKLRFQRRYQSLCKKYSEDEINKTIPKWFQNLMNKPKLEFITQFQKLDELERKRLNKCIQHGSPYSIIPSSTTFRREESLSTSDTPLPLPTHERKTRSQPVNQYRKFVKPSSIDLDYEDEEDNLIKISSGVELGTKNRYKDIFPYEHSRVVLKRASVSSPFEPNNYQNDISDNYINANYLNLPNFLLPTPIAEEEEEEDEEEENIRERDYKGASLNLSGSKIDQIKYSLANYNTKYHRWRNLRYIATQAPMLNTVHDFYTCIINDNVPLVLSLTNTVENGVEKCFQFWNEGIYNGIEVKLLEETEFSTSTSNMLYTSKNEFEDQPSYFRNYGDENDGESTIFIRRIQLSYLVEGVTTTFETLQLQIKNWPDLGTLSDPTEVIQMINLKNSVIEGLFEGKLYTSKDVPTILVHCSAGCGRTGTWCTIDSVLSNLDMFENLQNRVIKNDQNLNKNFDPVVWTIHMFRKQRISIVQTINQYLFVYDSLLFYFDLCLKRYHMNIHKDENNYEASLDLTRNDKSENHTEISPIYEQKNSYTQNIDNFLTQIQELEVLQHFVEVKSNELLPAFA